LPRKSLPCARYDTTDPGCRGSVRAAGDEPSGRRQPSPKGDFPMRKIRLSTLAVLLVGLHAVGCGSTDTPSAGSGGSGGSGGSTTGGSGGTGGGGGQNDAGACPKFDYTNYNPTISPTLRNEIQPILTISCSLSSSCHQTGSSHPPRLGPSLSQLDGGKPTDAMLQAIITELNKPSLQVAGRNMVVSGKPEDSYLMNKIEGSNACSGFVCMGPDMCGVPMPQASPALEKNQIDLIRAWIKKGTPM